MPEDLHILSKKFDALLLRIEALEKVWRSLEGPFTEVWKVVHQMVPEVRILSERMTRLQAKTPSRIYGTTAKVVIVDDPHREAIRRRRLDEVNIFNNKPFKPTKSQKQKARRKARLKARKRA